MPILVCRLCGKETWFRGPGHMKREIHCSQCRAINILHKNGETEIRKFHLGASI